MRDVMLFLAACLVAGLAPALPRPDGPAAPDEAFPGWPDRFEGRALSPVAMSERDRRFADGFPGHVQTFSDGRRTLILRYVHTPTRKLHPAGDCFRGAGWEVTPLPPLGEGEEAIWSRFEARRGAERLHVRERITDPAGRIWTDTSSWFWSAFLGDRPGPWWATTVVERVE